MGLFLGALATAGGIANTLGILGQGRAQDSTARYNARLLEQRARATEISAAAEREIMHERGRELKATQRAGYSGSGVDITSGTPLVVMAETAKNINLDILEQKRNTDVEVMQLRQGAKMKRYEGRMARRASYLGAIGSVLGMGYQASQAFGIGAPTPDTGRQDMLTHIEGLQ